MGKLSRRGVLKGLVAAVFGGLLPIDRAKKTATPDRLIFPDRPIFPRCLVRTAFIPTKDIAHKDDLSASSIVMARLLDAGFNLNERIISDYDIEKVGWCYLQIVKPSL